MKKENMQSNGAFSRSSTMKHRRLFAAGAVLLICCLAFVGAVGAEVTEYYVSPSVSADGAFTSSSMENPESLHDVLNNLNSAEGKHDSTIYLLDGTYSGNYHVISSKSKKQYYTTIQPVSGSEKSVKITGSFKITGSGTKSSNWGVTTFKNLTFENTVSSKSIYVPTRVENNKIYSNPGKIVVIECTFSGNYQSESTSPMKEYAIYLGQGGQTGDVIISDSIFSEISYPIYGFTNVAQEVIISGNTITGAVDGIFLINSANSKVKFEGNSVSAKQSCMAIALAANYAYNSLSITNNVLEKSVDGKMEDRSESSPIGVLCIGGYPKDTTSAILISENSMTGDVLLNMCYLGASSNVDSSMITIESNYWDSNRDNVGENPVDFIADGIIIDRTSSPLLTSDSGENPLEVGYYYDTEREKLGPVLIITLDAKGGFVSPDLLEISYLESGHTKTYDGLSTPTERDGYLFEGWYYYGDGEGIGPITENSDLCTTNDHTLTANWTANTYKVTFDADGGTSTLTELLVTYDSPYANLPNAEKSGHTFLYWKHEDGTEVTNETPVKTAKDHTLTAVWQEIPAEEEITPTSYGGGSSAGNYLSYPRTTTNGGLVDFGSSKVVKALMLPEGSSGSVLLKVDTVEKWPKALETEYTFDISVEKLGEGMAYIHFEIPVSTLESLELTPADIGAYHLVDDVWVKLATTYEVKDGVVCYEAETDSFSPFKLVIEKGAATQKEEENVPVIPPTEEPDVPDEPEILPPIDEPTKPTEPETPAPILAVLAGLGAAVLLRRK